MKKIIFLDVDGTLITHINGEEYIPSSALNAIKETREKGNYVYLCTGRSLCEIGDLQNIGIDGLIGGAGAYIEKNKQTLYHSTFSYEQAFMVRNMLEDNGIYFTLECNDGLYCHGSFKQLMLNTIFKDDQEANFIKILKPIEKVDMYKVNKITFISQTLKYDEIINQVDLSSFQTVRASWGEGFEEAGEIAQKNISKATAIKQLLDTYEPLETYGIGDSMNDLEMFQCVNHAIAMGNSSHGVEEYAEFITKDILEDGIEFAFQHYQLI